MLFSDVVRGTLKSEDYLLGHIYCHAKNAMTNSCWW